MFMRLTVGALMAIIVSSATSSPVRAGHEPRGPFTNGPEDPAFIKAVQQELILSPSNIDREAVLFTNPPDASNITFTFIDKAHQPPTGGQIVLSDVDNFPSLIGTHVSAAIGFVDPCGLNVPHSHPRANEFLTVVKGELIGGLVLESIINATGNTNGENPTFPQPMVNATLTPFTGMLFLQGLVHFQFNPTCEEAIFAAAFDNADSGRVDIANTFFSIEPDEVLITALGGNLEAINPHQLDMLRGHIPDSFAELMDSCAKRCGIKKSSNHFCADGKEQHQIEL